MPINPDTNIEPNETFFPNLSGASGIATISDPQGVGTILADDGKPADHQRSDDKGREQRDEERDVHGHADAIGVVDGDGRLRNRRRNRQRWSDYQSTMARFTFASGRPRSRWWWS